MSRHRIAIFGASGYAGMELSALLANHPHVEIAVATSEHLTGPALVDRPSAPPGGGAAHLGTAEVFDRVAGCAVALLAVPTEAATTLAPALLAAGVRVIDLSNAYRFDDAVPYGLPELHRAGIADARLVANPGCYSTAAILALAPLLKLGYLEPRDLVVDAMSGVSGAGRRADEHYSFVELHANARSYRVLRHQHQPEIARYLGVVADANPGFAGVRSNAGGVAQVYDDVVDVTFTPHLVPLARGILATCYARANPEWMELAFSEVMRDTYKHEPFVRVVDSADDVAIANVVGTNVCEIGVSMSGTRVVVCAAIDNLVKGAAGQAIQNLNLMLGCDEATALAGLRRWYP